MCVAARKADKEEEGARGGKECGTGCDVWVCEPIAAREIGGVAGREMLGERLKGLRWRGVARSVASLLACRVEREREGTRMHVSRKQTHE